MRHIGGGVCRPPIKKVIPTWYETRDAAIFTVLRPHGGAKWLLTASILRCCQASMVRLLNLGRWWGTGMSHARLRPSKSRLAGFTGYRRTQPITGATCAAMFSSSFAL